jgi:hypothetical protein
VPISERDPRLVWLWPPCAVAGLLALGYNLYDLAYPGHFVGDMYGMEVMARAMYFIPPGGMMMLGAILLWVSRHKRSRDLCIASVILAIVSAAILTAEAAGVFHERELDKIHGQYPQRSAAELLRIVREEKDQFAVEALWGKAVGEKGDPVSVQALCDILLDKDEESLLRSEAATALGQVGGDKATAVLEKARSETKDPHLIEAIGYALEYCRKKKEGS